MDVGLMTRRVSKMNLFNTLKEDALSVADSLFLFFKDFFAYLSGDGMFFASEFHSYCKVYIQTENSLRRY